MTAEILLLIV